MAIKIGNEVRLINKNSGDEKVYEVAQIIYSDTIQGVACITSNGIEDFYFKYWMIKPFNYHRKEDDNEFRH